MIITSRRVALLGSAGILAAPAIALAQTVTRVTLATAHTEGFLWVRYVKEAFLPTVNAELARTGRHRIEWTEALGGTVSRPGSELENMEQGITDCGTVMTVFHAAKMPLMNVTFAAPFGPTDAGLVMGAVDTLHERVPAFNQAWTRNGLVHLTSIGVDNYLLYTRFPITRLEDLNGRRIGGAGPNLLWLRGTGAVGVAGPAPAAYNNISSGVVEGYIFYHTGAAPLRFQEVAPHVTTVDFGAMLVGALAVNRSRWDRFPEEVRAALRVGARVYSERYRAALAERTRSAEAELRAAGARFSALLTEDRERWIRQMPNPATEWAQQAASRNEPARASLSAYTDAVAAAGFRFPRDFSAELA